ncbi:MAG TPA: DUF11 domain-containing protein [Candidatus Nanopelagicaceae bacterium]|nr:DUF11 domain-containing protein [Candidatus Nanopelagicaceae bacterium]
MDGYSTSTAPVTAAGPGHEMDPHLGCPAYIILWGSGLADSSGIYTIDGWSPSGSGTGDYNHPGYHQDQAWPSTKSNPGTADWAYNTATGGTQEISYITTAQLVANAIANGDQPVNGQGLHFKLQFVQDPQKHKTFWVNCPTPSPTPSGPAVSVYKTNDASGSFGVTEYATGPGETVDFQALITNTSSESETITSISDSFNGTTMQVCSGGTSPGNDLVGTQLASGAQVTCAFTIASYAPAAGSALTDTVQVEVTDANSKTASAAASSTVITPSVSQLPGVSVYKTNDANGSFGVTEYATGPGETVDFHALITNTSSESETITSINDSFSGTTMEVCSGGTSPGNDLVGTLLAAGAQVTCAFTIASYAPAAGSALTDTVQVGVTDSHHKTASAAASSTVITLPSSPPSGPDLIVTKSVSATTATIGQTLTYNITVSNVGKAAANDVVMTDQMDGSAGFQVNDGSDHTADSFVGDPGVQVTNTGRGDYTWTYNSIPAGSTYTVTYTATILSPGTTSNVVNGVETLNNTVTATPGAPGGCSGTSCTSTVTTTAPVPNGNVKGASTTKPSGGVLGASTTSTPGTGAHLDLLLTLILVMAGLTLIGFAIATRPRAKPQA